MDFSNLHIVALAMVAAGGVAYALIYPYLSGEVRVEKRQDSILNARPVKGAERAQADTGGRRKNIADSLKEIEDKQKAKSRLTLERRISQAGLSWTKMKFYLFSLACSLGLGFTALVLTHGLYQSLAGLVVGGLGLPAWILHYLKARRVKAFLNEFPNSMDVIVRGIKSGLPLGDCLRIIATEATEPVKGEFRRIIEAQTLGISVGDACQQMYDRMPVTEANFFGIVIQIQQKAGGNLSEALGNLSRVLRERKKMKGKIAAMSMEAKASAAIIGALPFIVALLVYLTSPKYMELLWLTKMGKMIMAASAFWMFLGLMTMKKMINFDI